MPELEKYIDVKFDSSSTIKEYALLELYTTEHIVKKLDNRLKNERSHEQQWNMYIKYGIELDNYF